MEFSELRAQLAFDEKPYDELAGDLKLDELSQSAWHIEDLFGEEPETYMHAEGDHLPGNVCLNRPDDYGYWIIDGDLTVDAALCLTVWDVPNVLVVTGDLSAEGLVLDADVQLYVVGATNLSGPLISNLGDAGYAWFGGPVTANGLFEIGPGELVFEHDEPPAKEMLDDEFDDYEALLEHLDTGAPIG